MDDATKDYYAILRVPRDASPEDIKRVYRLLAKIWHPDTTESKSDDADARFRDIDEAYKVLIDPVRRAEYDRKLAGTGPASAPDDDSDAWDEKTEVSIDPDSVDFGVIRDGEPGADAEITVSWTGLPPRETSPNPRGADWWELGRARRSGNSYIYPIHAEAYDGMLSGVHRSHIDFIIDTEAYRVQLIVQVVGTPSRPTPTPPPSGGGYYAPPSMSLRPGGGPILTGHRAMVAYRLSWFLTTVAVILISARVEELGKITATSNPLLILIAGVWNLAVLIYGLRRTFRRGSRIIISNPTRVWMFAAFSVVLLLVSIVVLVYGNGPAEAMSKYMTGDMQTHSAYITNIAFNATGTMIASGGADNAFDWSNIDGSKAGQSGNYVGPCKAVAFPPDSSRVIAGCSTGVQGWVFGVPSDENPDDMGSAGGQINDIVFNPAHSGQPTFAVATTRDVELWPYSPNGVSGECCTILPSSASTVNIAYSPNGQLLAGVRVPVSTDPMHRVEIWNVRTDKLFTSFSDPYALQVAFDPDGGTLAISTTTGIQFWNVATKALMTRIKYGPYNPLGPGGAISYSPSGNILAFADGWNKIDLWSLVTNKIVGSLPTSSSEPFSSCL